MPTPQNTDLHKQYKYFAFISYSSKDAVWGRYLQKKLEHYRLPARLASKRKDAPNRAYPIFRDETDLSGFKVRDALERELAESRFLFRRITLPEGPAGFTVASDVGDDEVLGLMEDAYQAWLKKKP